jgi:hypothetical protein
MKSLLPRFALVALPLPSLPSRGDDPFNSGENHTTNSCGGRARLTRDTPD